MKKAVFLTFLILCCAGCRDEADYLTAAAPSTNSADNKPFDRPIAVPEPSTIYLVGAGLAALIGLRMDP